MQEDQHGPKGIAVLDVVKFDARREGDAARGDAEGFERAWLHCSLIVADGLAHKHSHTIGQEVGERTALLIRVAPLVGGCRDVIPFFGPVIVREAAASLLVAVPVLASDTLNYYAGVAHYSGVATVQ